MTTTIKTHSRVSRSIKRFGLTLCLFGSAFSQLSQADVILHAFNWSYDEVASKAQEIADLGYKKVLVAPPLKSNKDNCEWWARYQPQDLRVIEHCLGNKESFQNMINQLASKNVETYADIVINQMANERFNSLEFPGGETVADYGNFPDYWNNQKLFGDLNTGLFGPDDFNGPYPNSGLRDDVCIVNYNDWWQSMHGRICGEYPDPGMPDLENNDWVKQQQRSYLSAIKAMGVTGFRLDAAKHMTIDHLNDIYTPEIKSGMHLFGEIIVDDRAGDDAAYDKFLQPYLQYTNHSAYDFPLFKTMREALGFGGSMNALIDPASWGGAISGDRAVTFAITHDIPTNDGFRYQILSTQDEHLAYSYIMGRAGGVPMILSDKTGVDDGRWVDDYKQGNLVAMIDFHNRMQGQGQEVVFADDCAVVFRRGKEGLVGINKCDGDDKWVPIETSERFYWFRDYKDVFTGETFEIDGPTEWVRLPARESRMWYAE